MKEIVKGLTERRTPQGICVLRAHYSCDPERADPKWKEEERRKYTSEGKWQSEQEIVFGAGGGERLFADILNQYAGKIIIDPDAGFRPAPTWEYLGGFDVGKANPTAGLVACIDHDGGITILREYYQPGLTPKQHLPFLSQLQGFLSIPAYSDPSIFYRTQAQNDGTFKAIAEMYDEIGVTNLCKAPENNELLGMERILEHWMNLDVDEPTLRIVCPKHLQDIGAPIYGVHNEGCPNLLWELRRTRREQLSATQLAKQNPSEKIVDRENHLRDCLKYLLLTLPSPAKKPYNMRVAERMQTLWNQNSDPTTAMLQLRKIQDEEREKEGVQGSYYGGNIRQRLNQEAAKGNR